MDPISDVLRHIRLNGAYFYCVNAHTPWSVEAPPSSELVQRIMPESEHLISYHVLVEGECWGGLVSEKPVRLHAGDVIVMPHGDPHVLASDRGLRPILDPTDFDRERRLPFLRSLGKEGAERTMFVCGFLGCDLRPFNPLLASLPGFLHMPNRPGSWVSNFAGAVVAELEQERSAGQVMLARLSELMFMEVVRWYFESMEEGHAGWLAALRDPVVGEALTLLHRNPERSWTLQELARSVGASRSVLAERFTKLVGQPPMQYLAQWRIQLAALLLDQSQATTATIASEVGYDSDAAFSRAFRKHMGMPPTLWRRRGSQEKDVVSREDNEQGR